MTDKTLLMAEAMNYIDERFIEEAHAEAKGLSQEQFNKKKTFRQIAAVACLCLIAIGVARFPALLDGTGSNAAPEAEEPINGNPAGSAVEDGYNGGPSEQSPAEDPDEGREEATESETEAGTEDDTP